MTTKNELINEATRRLCFLPDDSKWMQRARAILANLLADVEFTTSPALDKVRAVIRKGEWMHVPAIVSATGMSSKAVQLAVHRLHSAGIIHIAGYRKIAKCGRPSACYMFGKGVDAIYEPLKRSKPKAKAPSPAIVKTTGNPLTDWINARS